VTNGLRSKRSCRRSRLPVRRDRQRSHRPAMATQLRRGGIHPERHKQQCATRSAMVSSVGAAVAATENRGWRWLIEPDSETLASHNAVNQSIRLPVGATWPGFPQLFRAAYWIRRRQPTRTLARNNRERRRLQPQSGPPRNMRQRTRASYLSFLFSCLDRQGINLGLNFHQDPAERTYRPVKIGQSGLFQVDKKPPPPCR
jgi:hypothetical protein